jgi:predicted ester cyclase
VTKSEPEGRLTKDEAWSLANHWIAAWNAHDINQIISHYDDEVVLTSPVVTKLLELPDGRIAGKVGLRAYFLRGLQAYPDLQFRLEDVLWGVHSVVLYYVNHKGTHSAEFMELAPSGKITRVVAHYNG